ncbi:hypothetical protein BgAZ_105380 [Babesia gibsoni]|uniref:32 kDa merozoite antigen n=1 Tax=Babesia gibsoni TaxID=33632 RepID=A5YRQ3_BABGI|nr:32 kDa merozoite antigen [Babesia gibsoni]KAK1444632.1 hypothetical protein BgAZ_105380 [Babesia gibsoni]BAF75843.1 BgP32 [Babesia gibsoni]
MMLVRVVLFFPVAFSLVRATGEGQAGGVGATQGNLRAAEQTPNPADVGLATFRQQLEFIKKLNDLFTGHEEEYKKVLEQAPNYNAEAFKDVWGQLKEGVKKVADLYPLLVLPKYVPKADVVQTGMNVFEIFADMATDLVGAADKAVKTAAGMDVKKDVMFNITVDTAGLLFKFLPAFYEVLGGLKDAVSNAAGYRSTVDGTKLFTMVGHSPVDPFLKKHGFGLAEVKADTPLETLKTKLEDMVGADKPFAKVLCALTPQVNEGNVGNAVDGTQAAATQAAATQAAATQAAAKEGAQGQGEDGANFCGIGMTVFFVSVAVAVF